MILRPLARGHDSTNDCGWEPTKAYFGSAIFQVVRNLKMMPPGQFEVGTVTDQVKGD